MKLTVGHLYPDLLNLYGDYGNIVSLKMRIIWRHIDVEIQNFCYNDRPNFANLDIVLIGGGSDGAQKIVGEKLSSIRQEFVDYVDDDGCVLAICGGYQLLGRYYQCCNNRITGLNILDVYTESGDSRLIGDIVVQNDLFSNKIVGFENHCGRTFIGKHTPLGKVISGSGNNGVDYTEGIIHKNVIGTYIHGPILPKNPELCDYIIKCALRRRGYLDILESLDDTLELDANRRAQVV